MSLDLFGHCVEENRTLAARFTVEPFSVLNAREGWWQDRKRWWIGHGICGECGRNGGCGGSPMPAADYSTKQRGDGRGAVLENGNREATSIFDPVLCELAYRWFCPPDGQVLDPFAGGSVRGIVAALLGRKYWGCDLRQEQIDANNEQAAAICPETPPAWVCGDALDCVPQAPKADFLFSCPPYGDLERYSDDPRDLSTMPYGIFLEKLGKIIKRCWSQLRDHRFAAFVVGEFRDPDGYYRNFVGDTVEAFKAAGFRYYNEAILITAVGSLPIRVGKQFTAGRKLGKTHQNLLVFVKGNGAKAAEALGDN